MITLQSHKGNIAVFEDDIELIESMNQTELKDYLNKKTRN